MDNFYEQLVTTYKTKKYKAVKFFMWAWFTIGVFLVMSMATTGKMGLIIGAVFIVTSGVFYFLKPMLYAEYEYVITNGEIDIDCILEMKKRKKIINFMAKDLELLAPEDSQYFRDVYNKPKKVSNCFPETSKESIYVAILTNNKNVMIRFVPSKQFVEHCYRYNPKAVKK